MQLASASRNEAKRWQVCRKCGTEMQRHVPSRNHGYIRSLGVPLQELELRLVRHFGERDAHAARLPSPCPVCIPQEHDEGEITEEPGVARISRP